MAIILLGSAGTFPAGPLRARLQTELPDWRWTCGEQDISAPDSLQIWRPSQLVCGRPTILPSTDAPPLFIDLRYTDAAWNGPAAPPHAARVLIGAPTTDNPQLADRLKVLIASTLLDVHGGSGWAQFAPGENWLDAAQVARLVPLITGGEPLSIAADLGRSFSNSAQTPPDTGPSLATLPFDDLLPAERSARLGIDTLGLARAEASIAAALGANPVLGLALPPASPLAAEHPSPHRLPTLALLYAEPPALDWGLLAQGLNAIDPQGQWQATEGAINGRARLTIAHNPAPLPACLIEPALDRSVALRSGEPLRALRRHASHLTIAADLDPAKAGPEATRQTAKAMTMALAILSKAGVCVGAYNAATDCLFTADHIEPLISPLAQDEVSIPLFVWIAFHSTQSDAIALSTAGLIPFTGCEVEVWNAPGDLGFVADKLNGVLRYLLVNGAVIGHGDTIGLSPSDQTTRCFRSPSRAPRPYAQGQDIPALLLEFAGPAIRAPRADALGIAQTGPSLAQPSLLRRARTAFGRKGL